MAIDRTAFVDQFLEELADNIKEVDERILALKRDPDNQEELASFLRALHTIKGSSRMLKFLVIEEVAHGLENVFRGVRDGRFGISGPLIQLVFATTDHLRLCARSVRERGTDEIEIAGLLEAFERAYAGEPYAVEALIRKVAAAASGNESEMSPSATPSGVPGADASLPSKPGGLLQRALRLVGQRRAPAPMRAPEQARKTGARVEQQAAAVASPESVRIKVGTIDEIVKLLNNLIIKQFQLKKENDSLEEIERTWRELSSRRSQQESGKLTAEERGKREAEFLKLISTVRKRFFEELLLLERNTFEVQGEILGLRMLPLDLILAGLGKMVEETALALGKEIRLEVSGADLMLDKVILENLHDPVIHIVRNAIDHGLESPEERQRQGKARTGTISITCTAESGQVVMRIRDDGRGIDYARIRRKVMEANPHSQEEILAMDEDALNAFLFQTGFSTSSEVTSLSGRGVGLDIVRHNVERIKGKVTLVSHPNTGTEFVLSLPLSLATVSGFFVRAGGQKFLLPSSHVKEMLVMREEDKLDLLSQAAVKIRDRIVPVHHLSEILGGEPMEQGPRLYVAVVESMGESIGIIVDQIVQYSSLISKPLPRNLAALRPVQGIVFDESFNIINVLSVPEIMKRFKSRGGLRTRRRFSAEKREYKHVLVVDDSYATREIEKSILELENYNVETAVDGIDALEKLKEGHFHLIVTDVYMPRMDGFTLVENLRRDERYGKTPIIAVSSEKDREKQGQLLAAGVNRFIDKADFDRGNLVHEVRQLIG